MKVFAMAEALFWGLAAAASLLIGAGVALLRTPNPKVLGTVMSFGAGVLLSAVAFELVAKGITTEGRLKWTTVGLFAGAIVLGAMLDGIPESAILGLTVLQTGEVGVSMLVAVFVSNFPEGMAATTGLHNGGWTTARIVALWSAVVAASGIAAALGFTLLDGASPSTLAFMLGFSGGAILTMLATSMMPEAYEHAGRLVGIANVLGFAIAVMINWIELS